MAIMNKVFNVRFILFILPKTYDKSIIYKINFSEMAAQDHIVEPEKEN